MKSFIKTISSLGLALGLCSAASAMPIAGSVNFFGEFTATSTNFLSSDLGFTFSGVTAVSGTGTLGNAVGGAVTVNPFTANVGGNTITTAATLWTTALPAIGGFTFTPTSVVEEFNTGTTLSIFARGNISGPAGYDSTPGTWELTLQNAGTLTSTFSSSSRSVPDGGSTAVLLGLALAGIALAGRRKA